MLTKQFFCVHDKTRGKIPVFPGRDNKKLSGLGTGQFCSYETVKVMVIMASPLKYSARE